MVDIRSKIIEFLCAAHSKVTETSTFGKELSYAEALEIEADHLIANGVTIQRLSGPLNREELSEMQGEPVWIEFIHPGNTCPAHWRIWDNNAVEEFEWDSLGTDWLAYRHKQSEARWIPVSERLPEEHKSIFAGCYGTNNWMPGMFRTVSNTVIAAVLYEDGKKFVKAMHTQDGKWHHPGMVGVKEITHWMPLPEPPEVE